MIGSGSKTADARTFIRRADAARDERRFRDAATLYGEALRIDPRRGPIHVQAGHMFKETGDLLSAERHYDAAAALMPDDADLALQLGHFYKTAGRMAEAATSYTRATRLAPGSPAQTELDALRASGWDDEGARRAAATPIPDTAIETDADGRPDDLALASLYGRLAPENLPRPFVEMLHHAGESINLRQFGVGQNTFWGIKPVLRGVEAVRGFCLSVKTMAMVEARVNGLLIHRGPLKGPFELEYEPDKTRIHKFVFNIWCDLSGFVPGLYELVLTLVDEDGGTRELREEFVVEPPLSEADFPDSDGVINLAPGATGSIEDQINARPSAIHEAARPDRRPAIRSIFVTRADQLGDLVASIPGIVRLREIFPQAKLVGLFSPANADLARTLNIFDEIIIIDFRESLPQRTRLLSLPAQEALRDRLAPYAFDIAIDLSQSLMSRTLLALSGAPFTYGFKDPNWGRLTASVDDAYHDPKNRREIATHSKRIVTMIDRLGTLLQPSAPVLRRDGLSRDRLAAYGIAEGERYAVLHMGARIVFSRWPHYLALASRLVRDTDLRIVLLASDPALRHRLPADLADPARVIVLDGQLPFDDFDALLSFCAIYVGNDSGPKHLAALRGVPVVSIHSARINWSEWGQEQTGVVITRKVPCAGCTLYHDVDECGKDYVCVNGIGLDDVYGAVRRYV